MDIYKHLSWLPIKAIKDPAPVVPLLRLSGIIAAGEGFRSGLNLSALNPVIEAAFKMPRIGAVALQINSPGGSPVQSALIAQRIRSLAEERKIPVLAYLEDAAASGGYWLATAADEIYADQSSIVGSIGVISAGFGFQEAIGKLGVERRVHTSGEKKSILDPFVAEKPDDVVRLKALQAEIHEQFKEQVRKRRGEKLKGDEKELFSGAFWTGSAAQDLGLVDGLAHMHDHLRERFGERVKIRPMMPGRRGLLRLLRPRIGETIAAELPQALVSTLEERAEWQRLGL